MKIGILTYEKPHKRSQDLILNMANKYSKDDLKVIVLPWRDIKKKQPLLDLNLSNPLRMTQAVLAERLGIEVHTKRKAFCDWYLIGGAQLLGEPYSTNGKTLNVHPGILRNARGLDSFKRSLIYGYPLGCSLHIIDKDVDSGLLITNRYIARNPFDTIHSLRTKLYNAEQDLLLCAVDMATRPGLFTEKVSNLNKRYWPKRMTHAEELKMIETITN